MPELDTYDRADLASDEEEGDMTYEQRRKAEEEIDSRYQRLQARKDERFQEADGDDDSVDERERAIRLQTGADVDDDSDLEEGADAQDYVEQEVNLEAFDVPLREWITQDRTRREIEKRFQKFLLYFRKRNDFKNELVHPPKIRCVISSTL